MGVGEGGEGGVMTPTRRLNSIRLLLSTRPDDVQMCRNLESSCHANSRTATEYLERVRHVCFNLTTNKTVRENVMFASDRILTANTLVGRVRNERIVRQERFSEMLKDKYDSLNDKQFEAIVRCRRCGNEDVVWEEKQTRSADEGATVYCSCPVCKNRWVMRQ
jgi:DNA-directed RNA polymerase subunit M/transcription elongation factor TFIIS